MNQSQYVRSLMSTCGYKNYENLKFRKCDLFVSDLRVLAPALDMDRVVKKFCYLILLSSSYS